MKTMFEKEFNELVVETFHLILQTELKMIKQYAQHDLSMREIHLIEIVGKNNQQITISDVAKQFQITLASVTVMVNKLIEKDFVYKLKSNEDGRQVLLGLTNKGKEMDNYHLSFHQEMVNRIAEQLNDEEKEICTKVISTLNSFFKMELDIEE